MKTFLRLFQATKRGSGPALPMQIKQFLSYLILILILLLFALSSPITSVAQPETDSITSKAKAPKGVVQKGIFQEYQGYLWEDRVVGQLYTLPFYQQVSVSEIKEAFKAAIEFAVESADSRLIVWKQLNSNLAKTRT